jgi:hypothetical protein
MEFNSGFKGLTLFSLKLQIIKFIYHNSITLPPYKILQHKSSRLYMQPPNSSTFYYSHHHHHHHHHHLQPWVGLGLLINIYSLYHKMAQWFYWITKFIILIICNFKYQEKWLRHVQRMDRNRIPKQTLQYKPKGRRHIRRPRKRWTDQFHFEDTRNRNQTSSLLNLMMMIWKLWE